VNTQSGVKEEVDETRGCANQYCSDQRGRDGPSSRRRLMHVLRVTSNGPERRSQQQREERPDQRPRGNTVRDLL